MVSFTIGKQHCRYGVINSYSSDDVAVMIVNSNSDQQLLQYDHFV